MAQGTLRAHKVSIIIPNLSRINKFFYTDTYFFKMYSNI